MRLKKYICNGGVDMTDKIIVETIYKRLKMFIIQSNWLDINIPEQARALFTTLCFMGGIDADTSVCDNMLLELYNDTDMEGIDISYEEFDLYMCELLV